jgi:Uma2 family endonuclease
LEVNGEMRAATGGSLDDVPTLVRDPQPAEFEALLERRRRLGQDMLDEVWEGVYHLNPAPHSRHRRFSSSWPSYSAHPGREAGLVPRLGIFNIGEVDDYRVPDGVLLRPGQDAVYLPTAELVVEIVSPGDETWEKLGFYAAHDVDELLIVDPQGRRVHWLALQPNGEYGAIERSALIALGPAELVERIDWPE